MHRIATTGELRHELRRLLDRARTHQPSRIQLARSLMDLSRRVAGKLHLGPEHHETKASDILKRKTKFRKRSNGELNVALEVAAGLAKQLSKDMWLYLGNSYMHAVWQIVDRETKVLGFDNAGKFVFRVTPELDVYKHEVLGRVQIDAPDKTGDLHERIADALKWPLKDVQSMSLASLRELVRPVDRGLADEISDVISSGRHI